MNVTAEISGHCPYARTISSAPRPFWTVITVASGTRPSSAEAAAARWVAFVAMMQRSTAPRSSGSDVASSCAVKSWRPETRRPSSRSTRACSSRRVKTTTSVTCARCAAYRLPIAPAPTIATLTIAEPSSRISLDAGDESAEFLVGNELTPLGRDPLHFLEQAAVRLLRNLQVKLLALDANAVEAALLAKDDPAIGSDELGRERLDRRWIVELARDRPTLPREQVFADERLPGLELVARELAHAARDVAEPLEPKVRLRPVQSGERERDLAEVRVSGALAHSVDRAVHPARTGANRRDRRGRGQAKIVVAVEVERDVWPQPIPNAPHEFVHGLRRGDADRVDDDGLLRARLSRRSVSRLEKAEVGPRAVHAEERDRHAVRGRMGDGIVDPPQHLLVVEQKRVQLALADGGLDHRSPHVQLEQGVDVGTQRPRKSPDLGSEPGRLLAVAERGVVEPDRAAKRVGSVQLAGPDRR